ncbi:MAG: hypothetical protein AAGI68_05510 [Planctomycetota bacterium]
MARFRPLATTATLSVFVLATVASVAAYRWVRANVASAVYRDRLVEMHQQYEGLRQQYNQAVRESAITELLVEPDGISVVIRGPDGELQRTATPYKPGDNVQVEYVVLGGRLMIFGVYDRDTPPNEGVRVDPEQRVIDWDSNLEPYTLAIGRKLAEGRWVIKATGNGALGLTRVADDTVVELKPAPTIERFAPVEESVDPEVDQIGPGDVWRAITE